MRYEIQSRTSQRDIYYKNDDTTNLFIVFEIKGDALKFNDLPILEKKELNTYEEECYIRQDSIYLPILCLLKIDTITSLNDKYIKKYNLKKLESKKFKVRYCE